MWEHRNAILLHDSTNFHHRRQVEAVDVQINEEFRKGKQQLLRKHKHLLSSKRQVLRKELMDKQRWVEAVAGARRAWQHHVDSSPNYDAERRGITNWRRTGSCQG